VKKKHDLDVFAISSVTSKKTERKVNEQEEKKCRNEKLARVNCVADEWR
jgi:hypothetical protein